MDATALLCNICPKRPRFSDVSHLLTHVASKAHLSHYFKLQVRSHQEPAAESLLDEYNHWYKTNNLAKLLSDRLSSKDSRKKKSQGKPLDQDKSSYVGRSDEYKLAPLPVSNDPNALPNYIDPRLWDPFVSQGSEVGHSILTPTTAPHDPRKEAVLTHWKRDTGFDSDDEGTSPIQSTPYWSRTPLIKPDPETQSISGPFSYDPFVDDNDNSEYSHPGEVDKVRADEIARLKGVLWPGMDIFDSATEQMKRKRNQKKDESILKMMERTSMGVEPTELVFSPTGILRKQRVISGNVEDSSPLKGETPIPKKRVTRQKRVLSQADPNAQRGPEKKKARKGAKRDSYYLEDDINQRDFCSPRRSAPSGLGDYTSHGDDMNEFTLSSHVQDTKSRNKLAVFRDIPDLHESKLDDYYRGDKRGHGESAASQALFLRHEITSHGNFFSPQSAGCLSTLLENRSHVTMDKENIEPLLNVYGRIDPLVGWHSPDMKRHIATDIGLPPQYFFGESQHLGISPFDTYDSPVGYSFNPLATSLSKTTDENDIYTAEASHILKVPPTTRATSPDATIPEVEDNDFDRLYLDGNSC